MLGQTVSRFPIEVPAGCRMRFGRWVYLALIASTVLIALARPVYAQIGGLQASGRFGIAIPGNDYQSNCGHVSLAVTLDMQGRGRWFPQLSLDRFAGSGGGDEVCRPATSSGGTTTGGLQVENATRFVLGGGGRVGSGNLQLEGAVLGGLVSGLRGFKGTELDDERQTLPTVGGQVGVVLFRYAVLSAAAHWTRLSLDVRPVGGSPTTTSTNWSPMTTLQFGVRVPFGRP